MKKALVVLLVAVMALSLLAPLASAAEIPTVTCETVYIRKNATDTNKIIAAIKQKVYDVVGEDYFKENSVQWNGFPKKYTEDGVVYVHVKQNDQTTRYEVPYKMSVPTKYKMITDTVALTIESPYNVSEEALLTYANSLRTWDPIEWDHTDVIGNYHSFMPEASGEITPAWTGGPNTYTVTYTHGEHSLTQTINVLSGPVTLHDVVVDVKYKSGDFAKTLKEVQSKLTSQAPAAAIKSIEWTNVPTTFVTQGVMEAKVVDYLGNEQIRKVTYNVVKPAGYELEVADLTPIKSTDEKNKDAETLLAYLNSNLKVKAVTNPAYEAALGVTPEMTIPAFTLGQLNYKSQGNTYTFNVRYEDARLVRTLVVAHVYVDSPAVYINYKNGSIHILEDATNVTFSLTEKATKWEPLANGTALLDAWLGKDMYVRREGDAYKSPSAAVKIAIPSRPDAPAERPDVKASSRSITLANCKDYVDAEYSIDGENWVSTYGEAYTWNNVERGKTYTVYVRYYATDTKLSSACVTNRVTVPSTNQNKWDFQTAYAGQNAYVKGSATAEIVYTQNSVEGYIGEDEIVNFNKHMADLKKNYDTRGTLEISFNNSSDYYAPFNVIKYNITKEAVASLRKHGNVRIVCKTDFGSVELYNLATTGDMWVSIEKIYQNTAFGNKYIQQALKNGSDVYHVRTSMESGFGLRLPFTHYYGESLAGVPVTYVGNNGKTRTLYPLYLEESDELSIQAPGDGYYIIERSTSTSTYTPFTDARNIWAKDYISFCYRYGYFQGMTPTTFEPYGKITKAQMLLVLSRMEGYSLYGNSHKKYTANFDPKAWWAQGVAWAAENDILDFSSTEYFDPAATMTREECANVIYKMLTRHNYREVWEMSPARDRNSVKEEYKIAVDYLAQMGVMVGDNTGSFNPKGLVTRAEMTAIIYRVNGIL